MKPTRVDAYRLFHEGALALADCESAGMRVHTALLDQTIKDVGRQIDELSAELRTDEVWRVWKRRFADKTNMGSRTQLAKVLFENMGVEAPGEKRLGKRLKMDEEVLEQIDLPFVKGYQKLEKLKKLHTTYLIGVRRETVDGYLHPMFALNLVRTYRGSCERPNFQNIPIRDKEIGRLIRSCFIPRPDHAIVEIDYGSLEVRISACYNKDPRLIEYINDPTKDMHRDMAMECFKIDAKGLPEGWWKKKGSGGGYDLRFYAKNQFVFPEFYGSYYIQCAPNLWGAMERASMALEDGTPLREHLKRKGIKRLGDCDPQGKAAPGTFERHIQDVERDFWGRRFKVYAQWKQDWHRKYLREGGFDLLTGFRCDGVYARNDVINYPVQGSAFHCLLWSLIQMVKAIKRGKLKAKVFGQIHDSMLADVPLDEVEVYVGMARQIMTQDIRRHWPWIIVPLEIEVEVGERNWFEKKPLTIGV